LLRLGDANVLVGLFAIDPLTKRADASLRRLHDDLIVSDLSGAEFSSAIARRVRTRDLRADEARTAFSNFDTWCARHVELVGIDSSDIIGATGLMRRLDLSLRTPDAVHMALVQRIGCTLLSFDRTLARAARALGIAVITS
jgi:predicted nucleic acid-binding protein